MNESIEYYNKNAATFISGTINADMSEWRGRFLKYVREGGRILDAGCGSGRDSKAFMQEGFEVTAFDASEEMCKAASELTGLEVKKMMFQDLEYADAFDGIWACASLLHVPYDELPDVMQRLKRGLKKDGTIYVSFKYGTEETTKGGRTFSNFTEETVKTLLENAGFEIKECVISEDVRPDRAGEKWVNVIGKKENSSVNLLNCRLIDACTKKEQFIVLECTNEMLVRDLYKRIAAILGEEMLNDEEHWPLSFGFKVDSDIVHIHPDYSLNEFLHSRRLFSTITIYCNMAYGIGGGVAIDNFKIRINPEEKRHFYLPHVHVMKIGKKDPEIRVSLLDFEEFKSDKTRWNKEFNKKEWDKIIEVLKSNKDQLIKYYTAAQKGDYIDNLSIDYNGKILPFH